MPGLGSQGGGPRIHRPLPELIQTASSVTLALLARTNDVPDTTRLLAIGELEKRDHTAFLHVHSDDLWKLLLR